MSVILRAKSQPILDKYGLEEFHANTVYHKRVIIQSRCGKELFTIPGIQLTKENPGVQEVDLIQPLLETFLKRNKGTINRLFNSKENTAICENRVNVLSNFSTSSHGLNCKDVKAAKKLSWSVSIKLAVGELIYIPKTKEIKININEKYLNTKKQTELTNMLPELKKYMNICIKAMIARDKQEIALSNLQDCTI